MKNKLSIVMWGAAGVLALTAGIFYGAGDTHIEDFTSSFLLYCA